MDDRVVIQTNKTEFSAALLLGQQYQCHKNTGVLCADSTIADGSDKKESGNKEVVCQHDYSNTAAPDELCRIIGVYKRHV